MLIHYAHNLFDNALASSTSFDPTMKVLREYCFLFSKDSFFHRKHESENEALCIVDGDISSALESNYFHCEVVRLTIMPVYHRRLSFLSS